MDFYTSTEAKQYARNRTRIIKEINDIEQTIAEAVDDNQFSCVVKNTYMTDTRDTVEPSRDAKAHCIMELSKVIILPREDESKNYFRVGEVLALADDDKKSVESPLEFKVKEVNDNGDIIDVEIINRGEYDKEIFEFADLEYKDMDSWLDIDSNFGLAGDLKIDREDEEGIRKVTVKDYKTGRLNDSVVVSSDNIIDDGEGNITILNVDGAVLNDENGDLIINDEIIQDITPSSIDTDWFDINKVWSIDDVPPEAFGVIGDAYTIDENTVYFKTPEWLERNHVYVYEGWKMPFAYGEEGTVVYNVFGKNWLQTHCGWFESKYSVNLGEIHDMELNPDNYVDYTLIRYSRNGQEFYVYKCCHRCFQPVLKELDWLEMPTDDFGEDLDQFIYPDGIYRVKLQGHWMKSPHQYRFDQLYLLDDFGEIHDVINYTGEFEPYSSWVKMGATQDHPKGHWTQVQKVWDMDEYLLGRLPVKAQFEWSIKSIVLDDTGDGFVYDTAIVFSNGNATAIPYIVNDKVTGIKLLYGGDDYIDTIPELNFVMDAPAMGKVYYQVWKQLTTNYVLQDEMDQVMSYFNGTRKYTISRVTNEDTGNSFVWVVSWY